MTPTGYLGPGDAVTTSRKSMNCYLKLAIPLCLFAASVNSVAAIYHVSVSGSDTNSGTLSSPWRTIQYAATNSAPGDTVLVDPGIYNERPQLRISGITFRTNGSQVKVMQGFDINAANVTVDGFDLTWTNGTKFSGVVYLWNGCSNVVIQNCFIHDPPWETSAVIFNNIRFATNGARNCVISNNLVVNAVSEYGVVQLFGSGHLVINNTFKNNPMDLFHVFGANHIIRGNYVTNNYHSTTIGNHVDLFQTYGNEGDDAYNMLIERNEFVNCYDDGLGGSGGCSICQLNNRDYTPAALSTTNVTIPAGGRVTFEYSLGVTNCYVTNHLSASAPVNFSFNQAYFAGRGWPGDTNLATGTTSFSGTMQCPPLLGNKAYYLAVSNPNSSNVTATIWVDCSDPNNQTIGNIHDGSSLLLEALNICNIRDWTFRNNIFSYVGTQASIGMAGCNWYNNVFYHTTTNTAHCLNYSQNFQSLDPTNGHAFNNIFYACGQDPTGTQYGWYADSEPGQGFLTNAFDFNMVIGIGAGTVKQAGPRSLFVWNEAHGMNGTDPKFVNPSGLDFRLLLGSAAVGAGTNLSMLFTDDFAGNRRSLSAPWSIGALEYGASNRPAPPTHLRIGP